MRKSQPRLDRAPYIHQYMTDHRKVLLNDGRSGKIVRIETDLPRGKTTVSVWNDEGPGIAKVDIGAVVGPAPLSLLKPEPKE